MQLPKIQSLSTQRRMSGERYHLPSNRNFWDRNRNLCWTNSYNIQGTIRQHKASFNSLSKRNATELSKHIWQLKDNNSEYAIKWKILSHAPHCSNRTKRCQLCITEKYFIICKRKCASLNKRNELISKCNHCDKLLLKNVKN